MLDIHPIKWAKQFQIDSSPKFILIMLANRIETDKGKPKDNLAWGTVEELMEDCSMGKTTVIKNLKYLASLQLIAIEKRYGYGGRKSNIYHLNFSINPDVFNASLNEEIDQGSDIELSEDEHSDIESSNNERSDLDGSKFNIRTNLSSTSEPSYINIIPNKLSPLTLPKYMSEPTARTPSRFEDFWKIYPRHEKKKNAFEVWKRKKLDSLVDLIIADVEKRKLLHQPWRSGFVPHASSYLNGERWNDEINQAQQSQAPPAILSTKRSLAEINKEAADSFVRRIENERE